MRRLFDAIPLSIRGNHAEDAAALAPIVAARIETGDAILVKGSLGSRMRAIVAALDALTCGSDAPSNGVVSEKPTKAAAQIGRSNDVASAVPADVHEGRAG
jgi:hypothetical protein